MVSLPDRTKRRTCRLYYEFPDEIWLGLTENSAFEFGCVLGSVAHSASARRKRAASPPYPDEFIQTKGVYHEHGERLKPHEFGGFVRIFDSMVNWIRRGAPIVSPKVNGV